jgi:hypothetical protein
VYEQIGDRVAAVEWLRQAVHRGYSTTEIMRDPTFQDRHDDPSFKRAIQQGVVAH